MEPIVNLAKTKLIGLSLSHKTTNTNGQSGIDCGQLWHQFESGAYVNKIPGKLSDEIIAVYHQYEGDHTQAFAYFIGCRVAENTEPPPEMETLTLPAGKYIKLTAQGIIPDCIADTWKRIWKTDIKRNYRADFEVYDERNQNWKNGEVDIYIGVHLRS